MIINKIDFPIYEVLILLSIIVGAIYIYISLDKENLSKKRITIFFILFFFLTIFFGKLYTYIELKEKTNFLTIGVTGYGGLIGSIIAAIIYGIICNDKRFFKYTIISLPLMYSFAKLACFFNGCCFGIPYDGLFAVTYPHVMSQSLFPVQLLETFSFMILFLICNTFNKHKNIVYLTLILVFVLKFMLDFLRYGHITSFLSNNQIVSIVLCLITIVAYFIKREKTKRHQIEMHPIE